MTKEETKAAILVMQAYVDGKDIEFCYKYDDEWQKCEVHQWDWNEKVYRIKEESKSTWSELDEEIEQKRLEDFEKEMRDKEPKTWDWRGKNIQWIRYTDNENYSTKVLIVAKEGIAYYYHDHKEVKFCEWEIAKGCFEWSEDNATWRKFE